MKVFHLFLLLLFVGPSWFKPLEDDDPGNKDAAASDPPPDAGNGDGGDNGDKAGNADGGGGNGDNAAPSDDGDKKDKDASKDAGDAEPAAADISPADDKGGDDKGDKKPTTGPTPTPTGKTPNKTPTPTGKTPTPTKGPTSKPTTAPADNKDKVADDAPAPTTGATTNKPSTKHTSPSPRSSTKPPKSTPNPTIIKKASIPSSPKPTTAATTKAKTTAATTHPTTAAPTHKPTKAATSKAPEHEEQDADQRSKIYRNNDGYGQTVEKSNNNTLKMNGTTFRVAVRLLEEKWTEDLNYQKNPVFQSLKKTVMSAVAVVYDGYHDFKQIAIIGFTETPANDSDADKRDSIVGNSVIADFYLRFFSFGKHLKKLTDAVKNEKIGTLTVSPKFVKAYTAEPKGRVCTPDCKLKCYSYCDDGCCSLTFPRDIVSKYSESASKHHSGPSIKWSDAPISPHSQPIDDFMPASLLSGLKTREKQQHEDDMLLQKTLSEISRARSMGVRSAPASEKSDTPDSSFLSNHCKGDKLCEDILSQATSLHLARSAITHAHGAEKDSELDKISALLEEEGGLDGVSHKHKKSDADTLHSFFGMDGSVPESDRSKIPHGGGGEKGSDLHHTIDMMAGLVGSEGGLEDDDGSCRAICAHHCLPTCLNGCCNSNQVRRTRLNPWSKISSEDGDDLRMW